MDAQRSEAWFESRRGRVTGSVVGAVLGVSPFKSRTQAVKDAVAEAKGNRPDISGAPPIAWGLEHESEAIAAFEFVMGLDVEETGFWTMGDNMGASPDGLTSDGGLLEVKCPYGIRGDEDPVFKDLADMPHYWNQIQLQLHATKRTSCHFFQWAPHGSAYELVHIDLLWVQRNEAVIDQFLADVQAALNNPLEEMEFELINIMDDIAALKAKEVILRGKINEKHGDTFMGERITMTTEVRNGSVDYRAIADKYKPENIDLELWRKKPTTSVVFRRVK